MLNKSHNIISLIYNKCAQLRPHSYLKKSIKKISIPQVVILSTSSYATWYYYSFLRETAACEIYCEQNEFNQEIISSLATLQQGFKPSFFLPCACLQLTYASLIEPRLYNYSTEFKRQLHQLPDGGVVALDWLNQKPNQPLVIITHGLTGGSESTYIRQAASSLSAQGYTVVCFNLRGVSNSPLLNSRYHCHGDTDDLANVIDHLKKDFDQIYGVGISIGGNLLMKYAGVMQEQCPLKAIVTIGNPYDLQKCSDHILRWQNRVYDYFITSNFKRLLRRNVSALQQNQLDSSVDLDRALQSLNTYDFDEYFTRRINKFKDVQALYDSISCLKYISSIKIPVLCIHSKDDPIVPYEIIPLNSFKENPNIIMAVTKRGGHIEWYSGSQPQRKWAMKPTDEFIKAVVNQQARVQQNVII